MAIDSLGIVVGNPVPRILKYEVIVGAGGGEERLELSLLKTPEPEQWVKLPNLQTPHSMVLFPLRNHF